MKRTILMFAPVLTRSGYGDHAREISKAILESGKYDLRILPTNWGNTPWNGLDLSTDLGKKISECISKKQSETPDIFIQLTIPNEFRRMGKYNIGFTAGIESDFCKAEWVEGANRMDMLIGVSNHSISVIENSIYDKIDDNTKQKIGSLTLREDLRKEIVFEGLNTDIFKKTSHISDSVKKAMSQVKEDFAYLFVGHWLQGDLGEDRKDVGMLVKTFIETFKGKNKRNRPALILKTSMSGFSVMDKSSIVDRLNFVLKGTPNHPPVYLLHGSLSEVEMNSLYNHPKVKALVSFTKGEGFGRPLLEFSVTGKPVIAPAWSGQVDFLKEGCFVPLAGELKNIHPSASNEWFMQEAKWFSVNYGYASQAIKAVYENYDDFLKMAKQQSNHVLENFTYEKMAEKLVNILDSIPVEQKVMLDLPKLTKIN